MTVTAYALGLLGGGGVALVVLSAPAMRRPRLVDRLAPYLREGVAPSRLLDLRPALTTFPTVERLLQPVLRDAVRTLDRWFGGTSSIHARLTSAGRLTTVDEFRAEQVVWGAAGLVGGVLLMLAALATGPDRSPTALVLLVAVCTVAGVLARDRALSSEVRRREQRMLAELPTLAELLALAVTAGEGAAGALERVCRASRGELARELRLALTEARSGTSLVHALRGVSRRTSLSALARFVDGIAIAVERGTPLADVLRAQAVDVREAGKRQLLESAGRREIAMLVPVVFLILPVTVVFAFYPGLYGLTVAS